jgi:hypothetical protein
MFRFTTGWTPDDEYNEEEDEEEDEDEEYLEEGGGRRGRERRGQRQHEQTVIVRRNRGKKTAALHAEELGNSTQNGVTKRAHDVHHARRFKSYGRRGRGDWDVSRGESVFEHETDDGDEQTEE